LTSKPRVIIGIPTRGADIHPDTMVWVINVLRDNPGYELCTSRCGVSAEGAVITLWNTVKPHMLNGTFTHYLQMDTDIIPQGNALDVMLAKEKDIVCAPIWHYDDISKEIHINVHYKDDPHRRHFIREGGIEEIDASSLGLVLMTKKVFEAFDNAKESPVVASPLIEGYKTRGEHNDNVFFAKAHKLGFKTYVDWDVKDTLHMKKIDLCSGVLNKFVYCIMKGDQLESKSTR
jgi:hypothetical protein